MEKFRLGKTADGRPCLEVPYRGFDLLLHPMYNKSSAFTSEERVAFGLEGLLPKVVSTMTLQAERAYGHIARKTDPLEQYIGLAALQDRNEHLFFRVLLDHLDELLPIVYTPTVGQASKRFSHIFRRGRGIWITPIHRGRIASVLRNSPYAGVRLIVATDNEAILGIGDQGAGGMVIPIGKLAIYSAAAGIHPATTLPVSLDVGTDNEELLGDPLYLGWRERRLRGDDYYSLLEEFVEAVKDVFPNALLQWEDFRKETAFELLDHYRGRLPSFNDDIQGTGATALAGFRAADRISGARFADHRIVIVGGGAAGKGIALQLATALRGAGVPKGEVLGRIAVLDSAGLITDKRQRLDAYKRELAWPAERVAAVGLGDDLGLEAVVRAFHPTAMIGTSGQPGIFTEEIVRLMAEDVERPIVMPFSNPTDQAEATPGDVLRWTDGKALVATGSPFPAVEHGGHKVSIGQGNNALIFPGVGLGALVARAREVTDRMFSKAARALAESMTDDELGRGRLYPSMSRLREVTRSVAEAVVRQAREEGVGRKIKDENIAREVERSMWTPEYPELVPMRPEASGR